MFDIALTDHIEGPRGCYSAEIYNEIEDFVRLADELGVKYAWFSEHHSHTHMGHLPMPLLLALHLAGKTRRIRLGTAIICLNLFHPRLVAEQVATADALSNHRMSIGFGSGSTPEEYGLFGLNDPGDAGRHEIFENSLRSILAIWRGEEPAPMLPVAAEDLAGRCWIAVNSIASAKIAGRLKFNMMFSHLRTVQQYQTYAMAYRKAGGGGLIAANRPMLVGKNDADAFARCEPALRILWRRFQAEGKIPANVEEPENVRDLRGHPLNFLIGGPETVVRELVELHASFPFGVANLELRWEGLSAEVIHDSLRSLMAEVMPIVRREIGFTAPTTRHPHS